MIDLQSISSAITSLRAAGEMASSLKGITDATLLQSKVFELQREILSAQQAAMQSQYGEFELIAKVKNLEQELADLKNWDLELARYQLVDYGSGTFAYEIKEDCKGGEPSHKACPACLQNKKKSILQFRGTNFSHQAVFDCPSCNKTFELGSPQQSTTSSSGPTVGDWMSM